MGKLEGQNKGTEQESGLHQGSQPQDGAQAEPPLTLKQISWSVLKGSWAHRGPACHEKVRGLVFSPSRGMSWWRCGAGETPHGSRWTTCKFSWMRGLSVGTSSEVESPGQASPTPWEGDGEGKGLCNVRWRMCARAPARIQDNITSLLPLSPSFPFFSPLSF